MKIKNIIIVNDFNYIQGGASKVAIETAKYLAKEGYNVIFFCGSFKEKNICENIVYESTYQNEALNDKNRLNGIINGIYNFKAANQFKKILSKFSNKDTIIHVHGWTKVLSSSIFKVAFDMKFKVVLTTHDYFLFCPNGGFYNYKQNSICKQNPMSIKCMFCNCDSRNYFFKLYRIIRQFVQNSIVKLSKNIRYIICISNLNKDIINKYIIKSNNNINIKIIKNPINFEFTKDQEIKDVGNYYLFLGRVCKEKGIEYFCEAVSNANVLGVVVGDGNLKEDLEKKYKNINFVGWKNEIEVKEYIKKAKCLIFPSQWYEGAPLTPLEAMSYGIPCIISEKCSAREYVKNNNGYLFNTLEELENRILDMEKNKNYLNMRKEALKFAEKYQNNYMECLGKYYNEIGDFNNLNDKD